MNRNTIISESFNEAIESGFNEYLDQNATKENCEIKIDEEALVSEIESKWMDVGIAELDNITPKMYIMSLHTLDELISLFLDIAAISCVGVPDILTERIKGFGKEAADALFSYVKAALEDNNKDQDKSLIIAQAVYTLGCFRIEEYKKELIELLIVTCTNDELIAEAICAAIVEYDCSILEDVMKAFNCSEHALVQEHLLACVAAIAKENRSEEVFQFLKNAFRVVSNVKMAVEVIGDYGDGRAIPFLRGYIIKNIKEMDKSTFNNIRAVIKKLGGEIDDLQYDENLI